METDEIIRRLVLQLSGKFYEIKQKFLQDYLNQIDFEISNSLKDTNNLTQSELNNFHNNFKKITNIALDQLNSHLLEDSIKIISRNIDQIITIKENNINVLKKELDEMNKQIEKEINERCIQIKNLLLNKTEFKLLELIEKLKQIDFKNLLEKTRISRSTLRKYISILEENGYIKTTKNRNEIRINFNYAPWQKQKNIFDNKIYYFLNRNI